MEIIGYIAALFIGLSLGLIGAGGSILTVPILVYFMGINPVNATGYSLLIVGISAIFGTIKYYFKGYVKLNLVILFGIPSLITVYCTRIFLIPLIPHYIISTPILLTKDTFIMILFAILMLLAAFFMLKKKDNKENPIIKKVNYSIVTLSGIPVGLLTGVLGAGGGFVIVPALLAFTNITILESIATSLFIISINSFIGFISYMQTDINIPIVKIGGILFMTLIGMQLAYLLINKVNASLLKNIFAITLLLVSILVLIKEFLSIF